MQKFCLTADTLSGVWTALVTPFNAGRINRTKIAELVELAVKAGISGVVPVGTTGEAPALEKDEWVAVIKTVVETAAGRIGVIAGAGTNNTNHTIENIRQAAELGADGVLIVAPYYNKPTPAGLTRHFSVCADMSPVPIVLYHIPGRCGVGIPVDVALNLAKHPKIIGIKEAGGDVWRSGEIARRAPKDFTVLSGDDPLTLPLISVGARGCISVLSNIVPKMMRKLVSSALTGDYKTAQKMNSRLAPLNGSLFLETNPAPIKEAMNILKMKVGNVRLPLQPVSPNTRSIIRKAISEVGEIS